MRGAGLRVGMATVDRGLIRPRGLRTARRSGALDARRAPTRPRVLHPLYAGAATLAVLIVVFVVLVAGRAGNGDRAATRVIDFQQYDYGRPPEEFVFDATGPHGPVLSAGQTLWRTYVDLSAPSPKS